ncbi:hypothetical protein FUA23_21805 [Neolewinella aurantiaca]|uniref:Uncharacterized protein n=1 Tax=Neolewinella aurantiaca TaxID=2602767 RepID=A0A5C7F047_9BACT|nr:hypothetical protein [Neolewinella aurantiaca]TXF82497.1 hypothetical protein FUA23_21805 [Neolewinella aurantiaca]
MKTKIDESFLYDTIQETLRRIPQPSEMVMKRISWGSCETLFTPAYWKLQYHLDHAEEDFSINHRLSDCIYEEIVGCMLGLYEFQCEYRTEIFYRITHMGSKNWFRGNTVLNLILSIFPKFPTKRMQYITELISDKDSLHLTIDDDLKLRSQLLQVNGIGWKNASWITRNFLDSEKVVVLDSNVIKACFKMGLYEGLKNRSSDYLRMEETFIEFCRILDVIPSKMCSIMNDHVRTLK